MQRLLFCTVLLLLTACGDTAYHNQLKLLYSYSVPTISADSLARLIEVSGSGQPAAFILLDTRTQDEWQLSRIPGAQWAGFDNFTLNLPDLPEPETPVVLYCTIGYRSEQIGEQLSKAGYRNVSHLYGGLIGWKNRGYPLLNHQSQLTDSVHTYDAYWGIFLKNGILIYE